MREPADATADPTLDAHPTICCQELDRTPLTAEATLEATDATADATAATAREAAPVTLSHAQTNGAAIPCATFPITAPSGARAASVSLTASFAYRLMSWSVSPAAFADSRIDLPSPTAFEKARLTAFARRVPRETPAASVFEEPPIAFAIVSSTPFREGTICT